MSLPNACPKSRTGLSLHQEQMAEDRAAERNWQAVCRVVTIRDQGQCRACGRTCSFGAKERRYKADPHHLTYRSAGGQDTPQNVVQLCRSCHDDVHVHGVLALSGDAEARDQVTGRLCGVQVQRLVDGRWETVAWV